MLNVRCVKYVIIYADVYAITRPHKQQYNICYKTLPISAALSICVRAMNEMHCIYIDLMLIQLRLVSLT